MTLSRASIRRLQLSNFKLNTLLEITQSINENVSTSQLLLQYEKILCDDLNIGKVLIFSNNHTSWECILDSGINTTSLNVNAIVKEKLLPFSDISYVTVEESGFFKMFDIIIPVYNQEQPVAFVLIGDLDEEREGMSPTIKHLQFIQTITNIIVVAIENQRFHRESLKQEALKKELELASKMQSMLIPSEKNLPQNDRIKIASYYKPHSEVGGDYYDFIQLGEFEYGFCIADVSGKGISAAILMSNFQANFRALFIQDSDIKDIVVKLNEIVMENAGGEKFVTFFIGKFNLKNNTLEYINAGHNPPLLHSQKENTITYLTKGCVGLGMFDEIPVIASEEIRLSVHDKILCYTDGMVEAENEEHKEFGTIPMEGCLSSGEGISENVVELIKKLEEFSINEQSDDISILGVEFF